MVLKGLWMNEPRDADQNHGILTLEALTSREAPAHLLEVPAVCSLWFALCLFSSRSPLFPFQATVRSLAFLCRRGFLRDRSRGSWKSLVPFIFC